MFFALLLALFPPALAFETGTADNLQIKWVRDSEEYPALTRQIFHAAEHAVRDQAKALRRRDVWAVVLDVDETVLDNSTYSLERAAYGQRFDWASWDAWTERRATTPIPGATDFIAAVRDLGGRVAWITNRSARSRQATQDDLARNGLWDDADLLCTLTDDDTYTKRVRRDQLRSGRGACAWPDTPVRVLAYLGDTRHDLPEDGEEGSFDALLGVRAFILPNPMYGTFEHGVRRPLP